MGESALKGLGHSFPVSVQQGVCVHMKPQMQWVAKIYS